MNLVIENIRFIENKLNVAEISYSVRGIGTASAIQGFVTLPIDPNLTKYLETWIQDYLKENISKI